MRHFGLIGFPLSHSFSKKYFSEKFQREHIADCHYENYPLPSVDLFLGLIKQTENMEGLNITIPYKESVISHLDYLDPEAEKIHAVNCIHINNGKSTGFNTDIIGFERSLNPLLQAHHNHALILGTGGASKAVSYVLSKLNISFHCVSRQKKGDYFTYDGLTEEIIRQNTLIINTTPLGTSPEIHQCPDIPYQFLGKEHLLYDLIYNPAETLFLQKGKQQGAVIKNGYEMLVLQAEASWEIWNR
ncbi:MAG: shikimate dehydrogenase family protein [Chitinophagaceae bacterium]